MPKPVNRGLEQPVLLDVLGELVEGDLDGQRDAETPADLVAETDAAPDGVERVLLPAVALKQAALDGLAGAVGECECNRFKDIGVTSKLERVPPPVLRVHRVGDQEHDAVDRNLGPDDYGQVADV